MKKIILFCLFAIAAMNLAAWEFNGPTTRKTLYWKPFPGRFAATVAFRLNVPAAALKPAGDGNSWEADTRYVLDIVALKDKNVKFPGLEFRFTTKKNVGNQYATIIVGRAGRYDILWRHKNSEFPTDKPVWVFLMAGGGKLDACIDGRFISHTRKQVTLPLLESADEYRVNLGYTSWNGGCLDLKCTIDDFMIFDRILTPEEIRQISENPAAAKDIPGLCVLSENR